MRGIVLLVLAATGCDVVFGLGDPVADAPRPPAYDFRKKITISPPTTETLVDFPVALIITDAPHDQDLLRGARTGRDLVVTAADGITVLELEIEEYRAMPGDFVGWVRIPRLEGELEIYLYYGGEDSPRVNPRVWADGFGAVWHFSSEDVDQAADSTANGNAMFASGPDRDPMRIGGRVGGGRDFDGADDVLAVNDDDSIEAGLGSFTYSAWVRVPTFSGSYDMPLQKGGFSAGVPGYDFELGSGDWNTCVADEDKLECMPFAPTSELQGPWVLITTVIDRDLAQLRVYTNGLMRGERPISVGTLGSTRSLTLSQDADDNRFPGDIDEVRLYRGALPDAWILTEYRNLSDPSSFLTIGSEEALR